MFDNAGIVLKGFAGDTMHMARLEHSDRDAYSLTALGAELVGIDWGKQSLSDLMKAEKVRRVEELHLSTSEATREAWVEYSTFDTVATWKLHERLSQLLSERPWQPPDEKKPIGTMLDFYQKCWCPFGDVLASMEGRGVPLDVDVIIEQRGLAEQDLVAHTKAFKDWVKSEYSRRYAGSEELDKLLEDAYNINLTSPVQLRHLLFGQGVQIMASNNMMVGGLGLPIELVKTRTPKGEISLGAADLEALVGPDPDNGKFGTARKHLGEEGCKGLAHKCAFSKVSKALSSFLSKLPERVARTSGRVHSSFNLFTGTGRLSSSNPNLQQLPALDKDAYKVRSAIAPRGSRRLIVADYGQLDIRVLAHITKCKSMIEALRSGVDFHSNTALNMYAHVREAVKQGTVALEKPAKGEPSVPLVKDVFATERRHAKAVNFGIAYGLTAHGLAIQLDCSKGEAERMIDKWYAACPEVKEWQGRSVKEAQKRDTPYVVSLRGRLRMIPDLKYYEGEGNQTRSTGSSGYGRSRRTPTWKDAAQSTGWQDRKRGLGAQRQAINAPVQGGSADVVVEAMLKADGSEELRKLGYEMILQVHDELVFEGPEENAEEALSVVREIMENPFIDGFKMEVPLPVDAQITKTWADAKG
uniref:DNA-directed DNA polymerase family A palm domain-containing protein n=1 Tax=Alexandrium andersonii TaxID=327968 RepID=A0A7S2APV3_9DINO|mmetsp:Transcript_16090/g.36289  ORF Transcript_16090/g.36289 Transcript_16090/m.36289 type:complete len:640 (+) Transcript_16090:1-1920(+)